MCDTQNQKLIDQVIADFMAQGRAFTAFEVSLEAKKMGATERHRDMKGYIHSCPALNDEVQMGDYMRTLVPVGYEGGTPLEAYLYHPSSYDPSSYKPLSRGNSPAPVIDVQSRPAAPQQALPAPAQDDNDPALAGDTEFRLDYRNRLLIPTNFIRDLGLSSGEVVHIVTDEENKCLLLQKGAPAQGGSRTQMIERNGDLRLSQLTLAGAGIDKKTIFEIDYDATTQAVKIA